MSSIKRLSPPQSRKVNSLVRRECCNCDSALRFLPSVSRCTAYQRRGLALPVRFGACSSVKGRYFKILKPKKDAAKGSSSLDDLDFDEDDEETEEVETEQTEQEDENL